MFSIAILIGIYSYLLFSLGILGLLYKNIIIAATLIFLAVSLFFFRNKILKNRIFSLKKSNLFLDIIIIQAIVNLIGALGPELGFDALWYHLTLPKIFLENHKLIHIPGGLLYYSDMPKLTEMLYLLPLSTIGEVGAKMIHFIFGLLVSVAIYRLSRKFLDKKFSLLSVVIFCSNLVVGWQSTTAYIDLARVFFEVMAVWGFINWYESRVNSSAKRGWFIESAVMIGLAISTKLLSIGSLFIFLLLIMYSSSKFNRELLVKLFIYSSIALYVALPWLMFSFLNTGNPIYPLFSSYAKEGFTLNILNPLMILNKLWDLFTHASDPISPIYIVFLPLIVVFFKNFSRQVKILTIYSLLFLAVFYFIPENESRYVLTDFSILSIIVSYLIHEFLKGKFLKNFSIAFIVLISIVSIAYRGIANSKYLPVIIGLESKDKFLADHLNFNYGDFYDTDGYFKKYVNSSDKVLLYGFHNLYYIDFPFIDSSYVKRGDKFNYIAVQNSHLPDRFKFWKEVYSNTKTGVKLYSLGGQEWVY